MTSTDAEGIWRGSAVALKMLRGSATPLSREALASELAVLRRMHHPFVCVGISIRARAARR